PAPGRGPVRRAARPGRAARLLLDLRDPAARLPAGRAGQRPLSPVPSRTRSRVDCRPMTKIVDLEAHDIRFPTSKTLDGSDAMNPDPDYSAAYVILKTDRPDGVAGHG